MQNQEIWAHCGSCKKPIALDSKYFACDISTCRKASYCSLECFSMHSPIMRHKDAWAIEKRSPKILEKAEVPDIAPRRIVSSSAPNEDLPRDVLIVASKLKDYIRLKSGMNTSASTLDRLSDMVRIHCDKAIERARNEGRKTVLDRDFLF